MFGAIRLSKLFNAIALENSQIDENKKFMVWR
jgi:hypothetical protein